MTAAHAWVGYDRSVVVNWSAPSSKISQSSVDTVSLHVFFRREDCELLGSQEYSS